MEGQDVVSSDDRRIGTVVAERDGFAIVEMGHVFRSKHAIPFDFLHEHEGVQRATIGRDLVADSPKLDGEDLDLQAVKMHYGLVEVTLVDPDPDERSAEAEDPRLHRGAPDGLAYDRTNGSTDPVDRERRLGET